MIPGAEVKELNICGCYTLYLLNIKEYSDDLRDYIDEYIVSIWEGDSGTDLNIVKTDILEFLDGKNDSTLRMGAVAEFFVHLLLNTLCFKQECLFSNLEENSIKKGFDGYYSKDEVEWIMESKSGLSTSVGISHPSKVKEAYDDLNDKITGKINKPGKRANNPWRNAYRHASQIDVKTSESIRKNIRKMADNYTLKQYGKLEDFNIIPASTIFLDDKWVEPDEVKIVNLLSKNVHKYDCKNMILICATKKSVEILQEILRA